MRPILSKTEAVLLAVSLGLLGAALLGPAVGQPGHYHEFADRRALWGLPFAMDVLSNLAFAIAGVAGIAYLLRLPSRALGNVQRAMAWLFFTGLMLTAVASGWYHWQPDDAGLAVDRSGMAVAPLAAWPVIAALWACGASRQNAAGAAATARHAGHA